MHIHLIIHLFASCIDRGVHIDTGQNNVMVKNCSSWMQTALSSYHISQFLAKHKKKNCQSINQSILQRLGRGNMYVFSGNVWHSILLKLTRTVCPIKTHCRIYILGQIRVLIQKLSKENIVPISLVETARNCHSSGEGLLVQDVYLKKFRNKIYWQQLWQSLVLFVQLTHCVHWPVCLLILQLERSNF